MDSSSNVTSTPQEERTLKDLTPNTAALLCYVGLWISGIVFLVLEQKNRFVRFHALQSIIVFGALTVANIILGQIPFVGPGFSVVIGIIGAIFWIILMIKAYGGETYKVIWAGNLAEKLANEVNVSSSAPPVPPAPPAPPQPPTQVMPLSPPPPSQSSYQTSTKSESQTSQQQTERISRQDSFRSKYYSFGSRAGRITGSAFAIAWSIALIIFFNFFSNYIGYFNSNHQWQTFVTSDFRLWLPIVSVTLILAIVGHTIMIIFDRYWLRQIAEVVLDIFSLATIITLLSIFPFDFSVLPNATVAYWAWLGLKITLILISVGIVIGVIVKFIKFIVNLAEGRY
jgi:uncharacterized membrane protein